MPLTTQTLNNILADVKTELGYQTFEDAELDKRLSRYINTGAEFLTKTAGGYVDFDSDAIARDMLVDYCRYANSQQTEFFIENYHTQLSNLNENYAVEAYMLEADDEED